MEQQMKRLKVTQCDGEGQGSCKDLDNKIDYIKLSDTPIYHAEYIPHLDMWRLYDPQYVYQSVAYFDSKDEIPETVIFDD